LNPAEKASFARALISALGEARPRMGRQFENIVGGTTDGNRRGTGNLSRDMGFGHLGLELLEPESALDHSL
jgi:hypothetical protein